MQLDPTGTITLDFDGTKVRVKPPKIGQLRQIRQTIAERDDHRREQAEKWRADAGIPDPFPATPTPAQIEEAQANGATLPPGPTTEQIIALNGVIRKGNEDREDSLLEVWRLMLVGNETFPSLALDPIPSLNTDEWPIELLSADTYNAALTHFVSVPLASGPTSEPTTNAPTP